MHKYRSEKEKNNLDYLIDQELRFFRFIDSLLFHLKWEQ